MQKIKLYATGFELEVPDNVFYHDDGVVESIAKHNSKLYKKYGVVKSYENHKEGVSQRLSELTRNIPLLNTLRKVVGFEPEICNGNCFVYTHPPKYSSPIEAIKDGAEVHFHVYVLNGYSEPKTIQYKGHEETHVILHNGREDLLEKALQNIGIGTCGLRDLPKEVKCELGGLCALLLHNKGKNNLQISFTSSTRQTIIDYINENSKFFKIKW